ncbi:FAD-dependent monooxygenase [Streptomyces djakartensis]|uniref:FAD-dependent monooxygenase n=1 Tax=Streptomyces djakartensis TaxID=68193 RepID=UPI0034DE011B
MFGPSRPQAVVVGAGPAGLTAAHELARRGVTVRLVDSAEAPAIAGHTVAVHPRTLETFAQMGVVEELLASGRTSGALTLQAGTRFPVRLEADYSSLPTSYPYTLVAAQHDVEAVLRLALARLGVPIEWDTRPARIEQDHDRVLLRLHHRGHTQVVETSWLIRCDDPTPTVREHPAGERTIPTGSPVDGDLPPGTLAWTAVRGLTVTMLPDPADALPGNKQAPPERRLTSSARREAYTPAPAHHITQAAPGTVAPLQQGRLFAVGAAAQPHTPHSGPGSIDAGVQGAHNLAWKLAQVVHGHAAPTLLDTYQHERRPTGRPIPTRLRTMKSLLARIALAAALHTARLLRPLRTVLQRTLLSDLSGLGIRYPSSPLTTHDTHHYICAIGPFVAAGTLPAPHTRPRPGERLTNAPVHHPHTPAHHALHQQLRDPRWTLLLAAGGLNTGDTPENVALNAALQYSPWLSVRTLTTTHTSGPHPLHDPHHHHHHALGLTPGNWLLIRPDSYIAARGAHLTRHTLQQALAPLKPTTPLPGQAPHEPRPTREPNRKKH